MAKVLLLAVIALVLSLHECEALKCHYCLEPCEASKSSEKTCGDHIGASQEAVCTLEVPKDSKDTKMAIRKCQIATKGTDPQCPDNAKCTSCKTEMCNAAPSMHSNMAVMGVVAAYFAAKFFLN